MTWPDTGRNWLWSSSAEILHILQEHYQESPNDANPIRVSISSQAQPAIQLTIAPARGTLMTAPITDPTMIPNGSLNGAFYPDDPVPNLSDVVEVIRQFAHFLTSKLESGAGGLIPDGERKVFTYGSVRVVYVVGGSEFGHREYTYMELSFALSSFLDFIRDKRGNFWCGFQGGFQRDEVSGGSGGNSGRVAGSLSLLQGTNIPYYADVDSEGGSFTNGTGTATSTQQQQQQQQPPQSEPEMSMPASGAHSSSASVVETY